MRHRNYGQKNERERGGEKRCPVYRCVCLGSGWLSHVPCVMLVVHHIAGLAESKWLLSHMRSDRNTQVAPACLGSSEWEGPAGQVCLAADVKWRNALKALGALMGGEALSRDLCPVIWCGKSPRCQTPDTCPNTATHILAMREMWLRRTPPSGGVIWGVKWYRACGSFSCVPVLWPKHLKIKSPIK